MRAAVVVSTILAVFALLPIAVLAHPTTVTIYIDADTYRSGDTIEVSLSAHNDGPGVMVDLYIGLLPPEWWVHGFYVLGPGGWSTMTQPWMPNVYVPGSFRFRRTTLWRFDLPCSEPPIFGEGEYSFVAVLLRAGTFDLASDMSLTGFSLLGERGIPMVSVPASSFLMGSPDDEEGRDSDEGPQRTVNISAFQMSETEITEKQWQDVMGWNDCYYKLGDNYPVEGVSWFDCVSFCNELSQAGGFTKCYTMTNIRYHYQGTHIFWADVSCDFDANGYRLPTEAEWEYACRAGTTTRFYTGDSDSDLDRAGWYRGNSGSQKQEVGQKQVNAFGLYDMHGNLWEWCWDWYSSGYYGTRPDPDSNPTGASSGTFRVARGGGWLNSDQGCRSPNRLDLVNGWCVDLGLRLVRSVN